MQLGRCCNTTNQLGAPAVVDLTADMAPINGDTISKTTSANRKTPETDVDHVPV